MTISVNNSRRSRVPARPGFTLVELLVSLVLFNVCLLGLVASSAVAAREFGAARSRGAAALVAARRVEMLSAMSCGAVASGAAEHPGRISETWVVGGLTRGRRHLRDSVAYWRGSIRSSVVVEGAIEC